MNLESQIKQLIIDSLGLEDITEADIDTDAPLFGDEGLGVHFINLISQNFNFKSSLSPLFVFSLYFKIIY